VTAVVCEEEDRSEHLSKRNIPFPKFSIAKWLNWSVIGKENLTPSPAPKPKSITSGQAGRNVYFFLSHVILTSASHSHVVYLRPGTVPAPSP
jgi:hypothetical protein